MNFKSKAAKPIHSIMFQFSHEIHLVIYYDIIVSVF